MTQSSILLEHLRKIIQSKNNFPIGVLTYYGPDDKTISKIVTVIIPARDAEPVLKRWHKPNVASDPVTASEIGQFLIQHRVQEVVMADGIIGCPHEEGVDYPAGQTCPHCPFWSKTAITESKAKSETNS